MNPESIPYRLACLQNAVKLLEKSEPDAAVVLEVADKLYEWLLGPVPKPEKATVSRLRGVE
jgi:hypothetical protein